MKTVIKFSMQSCIPCQQLKPIFDDVVKDIPDIKVVEIDVEEHPDIASNYKVRGVPCVIVTDENDNVLAMKSGMMTKEQLIQFINES
jgi:thiol-disulfide isomerase/thioredoxin